MLSQKTKERLLTMIAVSPIVQRFALPGLIGLICIGLGVWLDILWLSITGLILATPVLYCYIVILIVYPVIFLFDKPSKRNWTQ